MKKMIQDQRSALRWLISSIILIAITSISAETLTGCNPKPKEDAASTNESSGENGTAMNASEGAEKVDKQADKLLKEMSDYLTAMKQFSYTSKGIIEIVGDDKTKDKVTYNSEVFIKRPNKMRVNVKNEDRNAAVYYDGKKFTVLGKNANMYAQADAPPTLDAALDSAREKFVLDPPGADMLYTNAYDGLMEQVTDGKVLKEENINGKAANHLAFKSKEVDWEIWIQKGESPVPLRYKIISKNEPERPEMTVDFSDWKPGTGNAFADQQFVLTPPAKSRKIPFMTLGSGPTASTTNPKKK
ncbi:DUF2092 domain-containing protein [Adhaeribacter terreus]|uniref:DUF2092 domain-containing protein n=1 Tax=Adhaeribacter terreus TaxID=529703 RepID=A0ABW0E7J3_9BACT